MNYSDEVIQDLRNELTRLRAKLEKAEKVIKAAKIACDPTMDIGPVLESRVKLRAALEAYEKEGS